MICVGGSVCAARGLDHSAAGAEGLLESLSHGSLGFLATPELRRTYGSTGGLNGMRDQIADVTRLHRIRHVLAYLQE